MNAVGRHAFWNAPVSVPRSLYAAPIRMGGRFIGMGGGLFMGQTPRNLESLSLAAIQNRILATPLLEQFQAELTGQSGGDSPWARGRGEILPPWDRILQSHINLPMLSEPEKALIKALADNPSNQDLDELAIIDGFFGVIHMEGNLQLEKALTPAFCGTANGRGGGGGAFGRGNQPSVADAIWAWMNYVPQGRGATREVDPAEIERIRQNPFFCGMPKTFPEVIYGMDKQDYAGWFGINPNQTWGEAKVHVENAITVMDVVTHYPFPPPIDLEQAAPFWILSIGEIREIIQTPTPVDPEVVRYWITMTILAHYSEWVDRIERDAKKKAKKARRKMIMTAVALAVASIVAAFLLPAIIALAVTAIKTGITAYTDAQKRKKAAKDMAAAAKMFEADAPGFSKEVDHAAQLLDEQTAREEAAKPPSPEVQAAIDQVKAESGSGLLLPVGGGLAAAGLAAFLIFR